MTNDHIDSDKQDTIFDKTAIVDTSTTGVVGIEEGPDVHDDGFDTVTGGVRVMLDAFDITNGGDIVESDFTDDRSDTANQVTEVDLKLVTEVNGAQSANPTASMATSFLVEVENLDETQTSGGTAGTSAE